MGQKSYTDSLFWEEEHPSTPVTVDSVCSQLPSLSILLASHDFLLCVHPERHTLRGPCSSEEVWSALYKSNVDGGISNMKRWPGPGGGGVTSRMVKVHCPLGAGLEGVESHPRHGIADCGRDVLGRCVVRVVHAGMRVGIILELCYNSENSLWDSMNYLLFLNQECFGMKTSHIGLLFTTKD